jgi:hypothetical protein
MTEGNGLLTMNTLTDRRHLKMVERAFSWGDAEQAIATISAGTTITETEFDIIEAFDGVMPLLVVRNDRKGFYSDYRPSTVGVYLSFPAFKADETMSLRLFIMPGAGASKGHGVVRLFLR